MTNDEIIKELDALRGQVTRQQEMIRILTERELENAAKIAVLNKLLVKNNG